MKTISSRIEVITQAFNKVPKVLLSNIGRGAKDSTTYFCEMKCFFPKFDIFAFNFNTISNTQRLKLLSGFLFHVIFYIKFLRL